MRTPRSLSALATTRTTTQIVPTLPNRIVTPCTGHWSLQPSQSSTAWFNSQTPTKTLRSVEAATGSTFNPLTRSTWSTLPSIASSLPSLPIISSSLTSPILSQLGSVRFATYGSEYQPSQVRRKRKHGFLTRKRTKNGRKTLERRWSKGRKFLSH